MLIGCFESVKCQVSSRNCVFICELWAVHPALQAGKGQRTWSASRCWCSWSHWNHASGVLGSATQTSGLFSWCEEFAGI